MKNYTRKFTDYEKHDFLFKESYGIEKQILKYFQSNKFLLNIKLSHVGEESFELTSNIISPKFNKEEEYNIFLEKFHKNIGSSRLLPTPDDKFSIRFEQDIFSNYNGENVSALMMINSEKIGNFKGKIDWDGTDFSLYSNNFDITFSNFKDSRKYSYRLKNSILYINHELGFELQIRLI